MSRIDNFGNKRHKLTAEDQSKGGKVSHKSLKKIINEALAKEVGTDKDGNPVTPADIMASKIVKMACDGNLKAWELVRDTSGQKPVEKVTVSEIDQDIIDEVENFINEQNGST